MAEPLSSEYTIVFEGSPNTEEVATPSAPQVDGEPNSKDPIAPKDKQNSAKKLAGVAMLAGSAKSAASYAINNIGKFTGSQYKQDIVNKALKGIGYASAIAINPVAGSIAVATDLAIQAFDYFYDKHWEEKNLEQARYRVGWK